MNEAEFYIIRLFSYFKVSNATQLSTLINATPQAIANWKTRNSVASIRRKCQELGIYNQIFDVQFNPSMYTIGNQKNDFKNSNNAVQSFGSATVDNCNASKNKFEDFDQSIVVLFEDVYQKFENEKNLKELFSILSELKWK